MNNNIDNILNSYFEGSALPEEERQLKEYFRSNAVLPEHEVYKPLFAAFDRERQIAAPQFEVPASKKSKPRLSKVLWSAVAGAAAIISLVIILFPIKEENGVSPDDYTVFINGRAVTNPRKAQQYADKMFMQAYEIIRTSYQPVVEVNAIQNEMDADKIFWNLSQKINYIETGNQQ